VLALALLLLAAAARSAAAQVPPHLEWRTFPTRHFRITYAPGLERLAAHAAERAEAAHAALVAELGTAPDGPIDLMLSDHVDYSNGLTRIFPSNRIYLYAQPPVDHLTLGNFTDWLDVLIAHELAHAFHLDRPWTRAPGLRTVFGRVPVAWVFFPAAATPGWSIEGLATYFESRITGAGRLRGSIHEMMVRTDILEGAFESIDQASGTGPQWPGPQRDYVYGSLFLDHLARSRPAALRDIVRETAGSLLPPTLTFNAIGRRALGRSFSRAWDDWRQHLEARYARLADSLGVAGLTRPERVASTGYWSLFPRAAPDGRIAFYLEDGRNPPAIAVLHPDGRIHRLATLNQSGSEASPAAWLPDGTALITSGFEIHDLYCARQDLVRVADGGARRLTRGERLSNPDVARDGRRVVAVQSDAGANRLVIHDLAAGTTRPLTALHADTLWALPRWSPDGSRIAAARWTAGGFHDIVVLDTLGNVILEATRDRAIDSAPAWSPDGRYILFWSDRTGIPNLFAVDCSGTCAGAGAGAGAFAFPGPGAFASSDTGTGAFTGRARVLRVTNLLTGAFHPEVSPDGRWVYFAGYHADGFHIERIPFEPGSWIQVEPTAVAEGAFPAEAAVPAEAPIPPEAAFAGGTRDSAAAAARGYSPWRTLAPRYWLPAVTGDSAVGVFWGAMTGGEDLVGRHAYSVGAAVAPAEQRFEAGLAYQYAGLPNPVLGFEAWRDWSHAGEVALGEDGFADMIEREDGLALTASLRRQRWRSAATLSAGVETVRRRHELVDAPGYTLQHPTDRLAGGLVRATYANYRTQPFSISPENGVALSVAVRRRWDLEPHEAANETYTEATSWGAAYRALPLFGFANHVIAARVSSLRRDGPGADPVEIGGASGASGILALGGLGTAVATRRFLPLRGFEPGVRRGTRAWTASLEHRFPIALIGRGHRLWPFFIDRLSGALFLDAGAAWCSAAQQAADIRCRTQTDVDDGFRFLGHPTLAAAGAEIGLDLAFLFSGTVRLRAGVAAPLAGPHTGARFHITLGPSF